MQSIQIGPNISRLRKEKKITQEELAEYLGVSKPAVSKWESGQSYPDILLLPIIASYFDKTVDDLLGYQPQMIAEDIKNLYIELADAFAVEPFDSVYQRCREIIKKYYSCWNLLFAMGELLVNHAQRAGDPTKISSIYEEAAAVFERVEQESHDAGLARSALSMRAYCFLVLQRPVDAIDLLEGIKETPLTPGPLLAKAYAMKGDTGKAKDALQKQLYQNVLMLFGTFPDMIGLYTDDPNKMDACLKKALDFEKIFDLEKLHPASCFSFYLIAASAYCSIGKSDQTLDLLEAYMYLATQKSVFPLTLKGNDFFDRLEPYFASLNLGTKPPRSEVLIRRDIVSAVTRNPAFEALRENKRFQQIVNRLNCWEENTK